MHRPVLLKQTLEVLDPKPGEFFIDGTVNGGGHALAILEKIVTGQFLGIDWDENLLADFREKIKDSKFKNNTILVNDNYKNIKDILKDNNLPPADIILLDLGFSSEHLESSGRGFSFQKDEPLLMTYSRKTRPAHEWLEHLHLGELGKIIRELGEERFAMRIAKAIKSRLPIATSKKLAEVIAQSVPKFYEHGRIHPATRTFQALRIFVNHELENLRKFLEDLPALIAPGGRAVIISFHSLEDRLVKKYFQALVKQKIAEFITKKPIVATQSEIKENPRSRSAKLRAVKFL